MSVKRGGSDVWRVLIVDDDEEARAAIERAFGEQPIVATQAATAREALRHLGLEGGSGPTSPFHLALFDLNLPDLSGISLCRRVRASARFKSMPIVVVTAYRNRRLAREALDSGADEYVVKPIRGDQLLSRVKGLVGRASATTPAPAFSSRAPRGTQPPVIKVEPWLMPRIPVFLSNKRADLRAIDKALSQGAFDEIRRIGHNLRGTAKSYGFDELGTLGSQLEEAAASQDAETVRRIKTEIATHLDGVRIVPGAREGGEP